MYRSGDQRGCGNPGSTTPSTAPPTVKCIAVGTDSDVEILVLPPPSTAPPIVESIAVATDADVVSLLLPPPTPPPPTVKSILVWTEADLEILYSREVAPGLEPATLPWGLSIGDIVQYLLDFPTLHVDDVLRRILLDPRYPRGTQRNFANLSTVIHTAQNVLRNVAQRCVTSMQPVCHILDRNDRMRAQVEDSVTRMLDTRMQPVRPSLPSRTFSDCLDPSNPPVVDLTKTPDDGGHQ